MNKAYFPGYRLHMKLTIEQIKQLKELMIKSAKKGNLANSGLVVENSTTIATAESWVVTNHDATSHSERMLVEKVCRLKESNYTPGLIMVTVCEPCLMCMSACAWAGYKTIAYIIPANKYIKKIPWMSENTKVDKQEIARTFSEPIKLIRLSQYETEFSKIFETEMATLLK